MGYMTEIRDVVAAHVDELRVDLEAARQRHRQSMAKSDELKQHMSALEGLVVLAADASVSTPDTGRLTLHKAMAQVLGEQPEKMMRPGPLAAEINRRHLYRMRDGRPVEIQQIHARVGNYPELFAREGPFIKLVD